MPTIILCCCPLDLSSFGLILDFLPLCSTLVWLLSNWAIEHFLCWSTNFCANTQKRDIWKKKRILADSQQGANFVNQ